MREGTAWGGDGMSALPYEAYFELGHLLHVRGLTALILPALQLPVSYFIPWTPEAPCLLTSSAPTRLCMELCGSF